MGAKGTRGRTVNGGIMKVAGLVGSLQSVNIICSVLRAKLVALWIGPVGIALFGIFNSALDMISLVVQLGLRPSAVRELGRADHASVPRIVRALRVTALCLGVGGAILTLCFAPLLSRISFGDGSWWWAFAWLAVAVFLLSLNNAESAVFQGLGRFRKLARCSMIGSLGGCLVSVPMFYFWRIDSIVPSILAYAVCSWLALGFYREKVPAPAAEDLGLRRNLRTGRQLVTFGMYLTVMGIVNYGVTYLFLAYLNVVADETVVGYYQAGVTLVNRYGSLVFAALSMEYLPRLSAHAHSRNRTELMVSNQFFLLVVCLAGVLSMFVALSPLLIRLFYSDSFLPVLPFVVLAAGATLFKGVSWCLGVEVLARGDGRVFLVTEISSGALNLLLSMLLYRLWGFTGLGVAYVLWYLSYTGIAWYVYRHRYGLRLRGPVTGAVAVALLFVAPVVALALAGHPYWGLPLAIVAALWSFRTLRRKFLGR